MHFALLIVPVLVFCAHGGAVPAGIKARIIAAAAQYRTLAAQRFAQRFRRAEQQIVSPALDHPQAQRPQAVCQHRPLCFDQCTHLRHIFRLVQRSNARRLCQTGNRPRFVCFLYPGKQLCIRAQAIAQTHACHAVKLGEGF